MNADTKRTVGNERNAEKGVAKSPLLTTIQAGRGVAAIMVVMCHARTVLGLPQYLGRNVLGYVGSFGHAGVDFFFVLSGFIIWTVHKSDVGRPRALGGYLYKRFSRIYPAYWVAVVLTFLMSFLSDHSAWLKIQGMDRGILVSSLLLLPLHASNPLLGVAWTLQHEVLFYAVFAVLIANRTAGLSLIAAWLGLVVYSLFLPLDAWPWTPVNLLTGFAGSSYHLQFLAGVGAAWLVARGSLPRPVLVATIGVVVFCVTGIAENTGVIHYPGRPGQFLYGISAALVVAGLATGERRGEVSASRPWVFMGAASYSIYLIHVTICFVMARPIIRLHCPDWTKLLLLSTVAAMAGVVVHLLFERPILIFSRQRIVLSGAKRDIGTERLAVESRSCLSKL